MMRPARPSNEPHHHRSQLTWTVTERFNKALTRIWLGDKPVQADLKKAMLGG